MSPDDKPLRWLQDTLETPPVGADARRQAGFLLRRLQRGENLGPADSSKPMPTIGSRVHELKIDDPQTDKTWRIIYRVDPDAIVVVDWFAKKSQKTPQRVIERCQQRLKHYDAV